jgi:hypothetical protein
VALIGNFSVFNKTPGRWITGGSTAGTNNAQCRSNWNLPSDWRKFSLCDESGGTGSVLKYAAKPSGYYPQGSWGLPSKGGAMSSNFQAKGASTISLSLSNGQALTSSIVGAASVSAAGKLTVAGSASVTGHGTVSATIKAALLGTASSTGSSTFTATATAQGNAVASLTGSSTISITSHASGTLAAAISPFTTLSPQSLAAAVAAIQVEAGLTLVQAQRLVAAAMAGKVSGAAGTTVTIRSAVADDSDRVVATVDGDGNRTAITYNLGE